MIPITKSKVKNQVKTKSNGLKLKYKPSEADYEKMVFKTNAQEFEFSFKQPSVRSSRKMQKYENLDTSEESPENMLEIVTEFIDFFTEIYIESKQASSQEFKEFLNDLPLDVFYSFCEQITDQVLSKPQKKAKNT